MLFLKSLAFVLWNMIAGYLVVLSVKMILFYPKKELFWKGKKIPFTPGLIYRKKRWLLDKIRKYLHNYLQDCHDLNSKTKISEWEKKVYIKIWDKLEFIDRIIIIPAVWKDSIRHFMAMIGYEITKNFFRTFVPFLITKYNLEKYIDLLADKIDVDVIIEYFNKYVYKYLLIFFLVMSFLIGIWNMIFRLIVQ